jgi:hypothetical protein
LLTTADEGIFLSDLAKSLISKLPGKIPLVNRNSALITVGTAESGVGPPKSYYFQRGFLHRVVCEWAFWSAHGDAILADPGVPGLDEVELTTWPEPDDAAGNAVVLESRWPQVRKWTLPPQPELPERGRMTVQEAVDAAMRQPIMAPQRTL